MLTETTTQSTQVNSHNPKPDPKASFVLERNIVDDAQPNRRSRTGTETLEEARNHVAMKTDPVNRGAATGHQRNACSTNNHNPSTVDVCEGRAEKRSQGQTKRRDCKSPVYF